MQWWCSAQGIAWSWHWRPYPGVWLFTALLLGLFLLGLRRTAALGRGDRPRWRRNAGVVGLVLVWLALDWPVGTLGAGYLSSVHSTQFLLLTFIAPPLLLLGLGPLPPATLARPRSEVFRILVAALLFNIIVIASHTPRVLDALMPTQFGAFAFDTAWIAAGLLFWQPVLLTRHPIHPLARIGYIFWARWPIPASAWSSCWPNSRSTAPTSWHRPFPGSIP